MSSFSKNLADKLKAAKAAAQEANSTETGLAATGGHGLPPPGQRMNELRNKAQEIAENLQLSPSARRAIDIVQNKVDSVGLDTPPGILAFFKRKGAEAREKYNKAQANEIAAFNGLRTSQQSAVKAQITAEFHLSQLAQDLAMEETLKQLQYQTAVSNAAVQEKALREAFLAGWSTVAAYEANRVLDAAEQRKMASRALEFEQDVQRARELAEIEVWKKQEENRLNLEQIEKAGLLKIRLDNEARRHREASTRNDTGQVPPEGADSGADD